MNGKDVSTENDHARATTATIDRRVERLEQQVGFMRELMDLRFAAVESAVTANSQKLDAFILKIETLITDALKQSADLRAQPLGRQVDDRLVAVESRVSEIDRYVLSQQGFGAAVRSYVLPVASVVVSILALAMWLQS